MSQFYEANPARGDLFGRGMSGMDKNPGYEPSYLLENFDWADLKNPTVVDLGGSHGSVTISTARRFPQIKGVAQDLPAVVKEGKAMLPADIIGKVEFLEQ